MDLIGFALAVLLIELTPGPNMAWLAGLAATQGLRHGLAAVAGVAIGLLLNGILAALGLATLLQAAPQAWVVLRLAGAAMMTWLAVEAWRGATKPLADPSATAATTRAFSAGLLINLLNPKAYIFFVVVAPQFTQGAMLSMRSALILAFVSAAVATAIHLAIVMAGGKANQWLRDTRHTRWVQRGFAVVMLAVAISFLIADVR